MDKYIEGNRNLWNEWTGIHVGTECYDVPGFKAGKLTLRSIEMQEVGDVAGKSLLHLQCHFGMDTLSWARLGAKVTGMDFSDEAINVARRLADEEGIEAKFVRSNLYDLPAVLDGEFDIVFTSYGVLPWLPDIRRWGEVAARYVKPGGMFYIVEGHPFGGVFDDDDPSNLRVRYPYFHNPEPMKFGPGGTYADPDAKTAFPSYEWSHSMGDIISALISAGLKLEFLHEFPYAAYQQLPLMEEHPDGWWRAKDHGTSIPFLFSLKCTKPE